MGGWGLLLSYVIYPDFSQLKAYKQTCQSSRLLEQCKQHKAKAAEYF